MTCKADGSYCNTKCRPCGLRMLDSAMNAKRKREAELTMLMRQP